MYTAAAAFLSGNAFFRLSSFVRLLRHLLSRQRVYIIQASTQLQKTHSLLVHKHRRHAHAAPDTHARDEDLCARFFGDGVTCCDLTCAGCEGRWEGRGKVIVSMVLCLRGQK